MSDDSEDVFKEMFRRANSPELRIILREVYAVAGFSLDSRGKSFFDELHQDTQTNPILKSSQSGEINWQTIASGAVYSARLAYMALCYHLSNTARMEREVVALKERFDLEAALGNTLMAGGENTSRIDFEYHGYVVAFRRCLDHFSQFLRAFKKAQGHSIRSLPKDLERLGMDSASTSVRKAIEKFRFCLSEGDNKSVRDRLMHKEFVPSGTINISARGIFLAGGGEDLSPAVSLSARLEEKRNDLLSALSDMKEQFFKAVTVEYEDPSVSGKRIESVLTDNPDRVKEAKTNPKIIGWFVGQVMKSSGGKANPQAVNDLLKKKLGA